MRMKLLSTSFCRPLEFETERKSFATFWHDICSGASVGQSTDASGAMEAGMVSANVGSPAYLGNRLFRCDAIALIAATLKSRRQGLKWLRHDWIRPAVTSVSVAFEPWRARMSASCRRDGLEYSGQVRCRHDWRPSAISIRFFYERD